MKEFGQSGRGGMGSRKHGKSGTAGPSPRFKLGRQLDADKAERDAKAKKVKPETFATLRGLMSSRRERP